MRPNAKTLLKSYLGPMGQGVNPPVVAPCKMNKKYKNHKGGHQLGGKNKNKEKKKGNLGELHAAAFLRMLWVQRKGKGGGARTESNTGASYDPALRQGGRLGAKQTPGRRVARMSAD